MGRRMMLEMRDMRDEKRRMTLLDEEQRLRISVDELMVLKSTHTVRMKIKRDEHNAVFH